MKKLQFDTITFKNHVGTKGGQKFLTLQAWQDGKYMETLMTPLDFIFTLSDCEKYFKVDEIINGKKAQTDYYGMEVFEVELAKRKSKVWTMEDSIKGNGWKTEVTETNETKLETIGILARKDV